MTSSLFGFLHFAREKTHETQPLFPLAAAATLQSGKMGSFLLPSAQRRQLLVSLAGVMTAPQGLLPLSSLANVYLRRIREKVTPAVSQQRPLAPIFILIVLISIVHRTVHPPHW